MSYYYQQKKQPAKKPRRFPKIALSFLLILLVAAAIIGGLEATDKTHLFHKTPPPAITASPDTKGESATPTPPPPTPSIQPGDDKSTTSSDPSPTASLVVPTGNFVSNHHPASADSLQSSCNTTAGATCQITFTKDGTTKSLPPQTTDRGGAAYWTWKVQDIGLGTGTWGIEAKATLGIQTKTTTDELKLEVTQ